MQKIYVCLTTISSRLADVHQVIESLLAQSLDASAFEVRLYLSREPYLLDEGCSTLTPALRRLRVTEASRFSVVYVANTGPYRKIMPLLQELYSGPMAEFRDSLIATADDDTIYPPDWLEGLLKCFQSQRCVVGYRGRVILFEGGSPVAYRHWQKVVKQNPAPQNLLTGKDGVLYSPLHLHPAVRNMDAALVVAPKADDLWLKVHAMLLGCPSYVINQSLEEEFPSVRGMEPAVSLYRSFNQRGGNDDATRSIDAYLTNAFGTSLIELCRDGPPRLDIIATSAA